VERARAHLGEPAVQSNAGELQTRQDEMTKSEKILEELLRRWEKLEERR
jgi:hypothetical protein